MNNIETTLQQREKILELINLIKDKSTPEFMKKIYSTKCELNLIKYQGKDFSELWNDYLIIKK